MTSSGMKRGLATIAVSALAVTGLPALAGTANATPIATTFADADDIAFYSQVVPGLSAKNDGTNTTVSLVTGGGANVESVLYQYSLAAAPATWIDVPGGLVARNADGVFAFDWANPPATVAAVRAVPSTGEGNAVTAAAPNLGDAANTVELATEGALGVFQEPYSETAGDQDLVGVTGTASSNANVSVSDESHGTGSVAATETNDGDPATPETFHAVLDIDGYPYSGGTEPNQIALNASTDTDDAEGSTLYLQTIGSIEATPATQEKADPATSVITVTVKDTAGKPVAGAQVGLADLDTDGAGPDTDGADTILGYTDGNGQYVDSARTTAETFTYFVNKTDGNELEAGDPSDTATVSTYTPALSTVDIVNERDRSNFDLDELGDGDDFTIVTKDQRGSAINEDLAGADVEYRWVIDPSGAGDTFTSAWMAAETDAEGEAPVLGLTDTSYNGGAVPEGSYTIEARRPNVNGAGLTNATPETFKASESEITYDEGTSANAPVNGDFTVTGTLANDGGGLGGREVQLTYTPGLGNNATFAPQSEQPAGVTVTGNTATAVTDSTGDFAVKLRDPAVPANVTPKAEDGSLNAIAEESATDTTSLQGDLGPNDSTVPNDADNAEQDLAIHFKAAETPASIDIDVDSLIDEMYTPGRPAELDVQVYNADEQALSDFPITVSVDHGFLSPNANVEADLEPAAGSDDDGDLYGVWKDSGTSRDISTGDGANAGIVAAIERDSGFDDDGLVTMTVTVKAGNLTEHRSITFHSDHPLNSGGLTLDRMDGEPQGDVTVGDTVEYNVFSKDQFGNLAGNEYVRILDNTTVADFTTDATEDQANSDFNNDGDSISAFATAATKQTLEGRWNTAKTTWNDDERANSNQTVSDTDTINWVVSTPVPERKSIVAELSLKNAAGGVDKATVNAPKAAAGARVKIFKIRKDGTKKLIAIKRANKYGNAKFAIDDKNGNKFTKYQAKVAQTPRTFKDWTPKKSVR